MITVISSFHNESKNCNSFLKMIEEASIFLPIDQLVVVDNGSLDETYQKLIDLKSSKFEILVIKNPLLSKYGDGFHAAFKKSKNEFVLTLHSDLQYNLVDFTKNNLTLINLCIKSKTNIFPARANRPLFAEIRSCLFRFLLSLIYLTNFNDFNGHPKLLIKEDFSKMQFFCSSFAYDLSLFYYLKKTNKKINISCRTIEATRVHGESSWNKNFFSQFVELFNNINDLRKFKFHNFKSR
jgi:glycosyltransferase involved in cell wall biosynthesis